jgi:hypothetical protein
MRLVLFACALLATAASAAAAQPDVRPVAPFLAASPRANAVVLRDRPGGKPLATLAARTAFGSPETVGIAEQQGPWVGVISTELANGVLGWVQRSELAVRPVDWSIDVSLASRVLVVRHGGAVVRRVSVGIGEASSPTPPGRYIVTDHIDPNADQDAYGCCILALSGHQPNPPAGWDRTRDWRLAIHGGATGAVSAGCVHADEATLRYLMRLTPLGTPVTVSP